MATHTTVAALSDTELVARLTQLLGRERHCLADILVHLAEVDERRCYLAAGFSSLFRYAVDHLGMSEYQAGHASRSRGCCRGFPSCTR